ncbi:hypothetical protein RSO01_83330 [Reyranella soli]|uniref:SMODS and SLOG-associating 2TM effector domain-containing protein n=2 Tax=Reyranella soli TaxID=1230389 RepID=A0A512NQF6_9HYPH|nr:hypothetical protein RSO01_83330 [Reyranella soli]
MEGDALSFYTRSAWINFWLWHLFAGLGFLSSVGAILAAALINDAAYKDVGRTLLIVIPTVGTLSAGLLHLFKFREKERLREEGRIELCDIIDNARSMSISGQNEDEHKKHYHTIRERFRQLELSQSTSDSKLKSDDLSKVRT